MVPEAFDGPIPAVIELSDVNCAFTLLELLEAVEALSHVTKASFVLLGPVAVPGALHFAGHVEVKLITTDFIGMTRGKVVEHLFEHVPTFRKGRGVCLILHDIKCLPDTDFSYSLIRNVETLRECST